ncbi:MAG: small membrane protein YmiC [Leclercia sp.]
MLNNIRGIKYWSWMGAFSLSLLLWCQLIWLALH